MSIFTRPASDTEKIVESIKRPIQKKYLTK